jgi:iron(III) transport system permease protein
VALTASGWRSGALIALALAFALPLLVVLSSWLAGPSGNWAHLASTVLGNYALNSLVLCLLTGSGTLVLGTGSAWLVAVHEFPGRRVLEWALLLPLACPAYLIAYTWTGLLALEGPLQQWAPFPLPEIRNRAGAAVMLTLVLYPYVYLLARQAFLTQSGTALDVARTLGAGPRERFVRVALPLARPAIVAGLALVLMETLADYGTVKYFGVSTLSTGIYRTWFGLGDHLAAAQLASGLLFTMFVLLWLERRARRQRRTDTDQKPTGERRPLTGLPAPAATVGLTLPVLLGFGLPALQLLAWAADDAGHLLSAEFVELTYNSLLIAVLTALTTLAVALVLVTAHRLLPTHTRRLAMRAVAFGYAMPGTVLAVGVVWVLGWLDSGVNETAARLGWQEPGLVFSGTLFAVVFACSIRFLSIPAQGLEAGFARLSPHMDEAARSLGGRPWSLFRRIHLPLLRIPLLTSALLVFVDTLKELPATMVLRPFDTNTLAVRAFELASDERLADAALPALAILVAGILPVSLLARSMGNRDDGQDA